MKPKTLLWWGLGSLAAALVLGVAVLSDMAEPPAFDAWWREVVIENRTEWMLSAALVLDRVGGGLIAVLAVPLIIVVALVASGRWRAAVFAGASFFLSAAMVQVLKNIYGRARPDDMIVASDFGSFPSGHAANAMTIALVLFLLFPRAWVAALGILWVLAMALSRTLLSVHWASDTIGGALVGASIPLLLAAWLLPWARLRIPRRSE